MRVGLIDYGAGNLFSLHSALEHLGHQVVSIGNEENLSGVDQLILPGVGAFGTGMAELHARGLVEPIRTYASEGRPLLGICLGAQLMLSRGNEFGLHEGLGLFAGQVKAIRDGAKPSPMIGWAPLQWHSDEFAEFHTDWMYFVHSFAMVPDDNSAILASRYTSGITYVAAIHQRSIVGLQFHPEKSGPRGLRLLNSLLKRKI